MLCSCLIMKEDDPSVVFWSGIIQRIIYIVTSWKTWSEMNQVCFVKLCNLIKLLGSQRNNFCLILPQIHSAKTSENQIWRTDQFPFESFIQCHWAVLKKKKKQNPNNWIFSFWMSIFTKCRCLQLNKLCIKHKFSWYDAVQTSCGATEQSSASLIFFAYFLAWKIKMQI